MKLLDLIKTHGEPDILLDGWDENDTPKAIWNFEDVFVINSNGKAILNDKPVSGNPFNLFQKILNKWKANSDDLAAIGYMSYDLKNILYPHLNFKPIKRLTPLLWFAKPNKILPYEITHDDDETIPLDLSLIKNIPNPKNYEKSINVIKSYLAQGDSYQINFTQPKKYQLKGNPFDIYLSMREKIKPNCGMYVNLGGMQILSYSPETFFQTHDGIIESFPMKGTRPRSYDIIQDELLAGELHNSEKDRAEHLMIVDLIRNDIGKVCEFGSIQVDNLYGIQSFETVHQMVSRVHGALSSNTLEIDIIKALFPGGSITGAPKERSMEIIDTLENYHRGIYTGALGSIASNGDMDFNIAIRTMTMQNNIATYPVGGGIVWDSNPMEEWNEAQQKSKIIDICTNKINQNKHELELDSNI